MPKETIKLLDGTEIVRDDRTLAEAQAQARERIAIYYADDLADGVEVGGLTLGTTAEDQQQFGHGMTLANSALQLQLCTLQTPASQLFGRTVSDINGGQHDMTVGEYMAMAIAYAQAIGALQAKRNTKLAAIDATQTNEAADAVEWSD